MKKKLIVLPVVVLALTGAGGVALSAGPSHEDTAKRVAAACKALESVHGSVIGASMTTTLGAEGADLAESLAESNPIIVEDVVRKLDGIGASASDADRTTLVGITADLGRASGALKQGDVEGAYEAGSDFVSTAADRFGVKCPNPGGNEQAVKDAAVAPLNAACDKWRSLIGQTGEKLGKLADVPDDEGADSIDQLASRTQEFARAVRATGVEGSAEMVDALQAASRTAARSADSWRDGYYSESDIDGLSESLFKALDEGENLGASACARG